MTPAEQPAGGLEWKGNAGVFERNRRLCQDEADAAEKRGDLSRARTWKRQADDWTKSRDEEQRREEMRLENRRARRGLF